MYIYTLQPCFLEVSQRSVRRGGYKTPSTLLVPHVFIMSQLRLHSMMPRNPAPMLVDRWLRLPHISTRLPSPTTCMYSYSSMNLIFSDLGCFGRTCLLDPFTNRLGWVEQMRNKILLVQFGQSNQAVDNGCYSGFLTCCQISHDMPFVRLHLYFGSKIFLG